MGRDASAGEGDMSHITAADSAEEVEMMSDQTWLAESATVLALQKGACCSIAPVLAWTSGAVRACSWCLNCQ